MFRGAFDIFKMYFRLRPAGISYDIGTFELVVRGTFIVVGTLAFSFYIFALFDNLDQAVAQSRQLHEQELEFERQQSSQNLELQKVKDRMGKIEYDLEQVKLQHEALIRRTDVLQSNQVSVMQTLSIIKYVAMGIIALWLDRLGGFTVTLLEHRAKSKVVA